MSRSIFCAWTARRSCAVVVIVGLLASVPLTDSLAAGNHVKRQDQLATHAYLKADYAYQQALLAGAAAAETAVEELAGKFAQECPGILKGAPGKARLLEAAPPTHFPSGRQLGEENRQRRQRDELLQEVARALSVAALGPVRQQTLEFAASLQTLHWSNRALTDLIHGDASDVVLELEGAPLNVCADLKAWVSSGYKTVSLQTKAFEQRQEALLAAFQRDLRLNPKAIFGTSAVLSFKTASAKSLERRIQALRRANHSARRRLAIELRLQSILLGGEPQIKVPKRPRTHPVSIGHGKTAAGTSYTIRIVRAHPSRGEPHCSWNVEVTETTSRGRSGRPAVVGSDTGETCLSIEHPERPHVDCQLGRLVVEGQTRPRARFVRLRLSDGRQITSKVALIPPRLGGPAGYYYQAVRGPSPIPVSAVELDARGRTLHTIRLHHLRYCTAHPFYYPPGGVRRLVHDKVPDGGPPFTIVGKRYRFRGRFHFSLNLEVEQELGSSTGEETIIAGGENGSRRAPVPFEPQIEPNCLPHEYAIAYGLLKAPDDVVLARVGTAMIAFRKVGLPASLHTKGVLAYAVLSSVPSELIVRTPKGKTILDEKLGGFAQETAEQCEGEIER